MTGTSYSRMGSEASWAISPFPGRWDFINGIIAAPTCHVARPGTGLLRHIEITARRDDARGNLIAMRRSRPCVESTGLRRFAPTTTTSSILTACKYGISVRPPVPGPELEEPPPKACHPPRPWGTLLSAVPHVLHRDNDRPSVWCRLGPVGRGPSRPSPTVGRTGDRAAGSPTPPAGMARAERTGRPCGPRRDQKRRLSVRLPPKSVLPKPAVA